MKEENGEENGEEIEVIIENDEATQIYENMLLIQNEIESLKQNILIFKSRYDVLSLKNLLSNKDNENENENENELTDLDLKINNIQEIIINKEKYLLILDNDLDKKSSSSSSENVVQKERKERKLAKKLKKIEKLCSN